MYRKTETDEIDIMEASGNEPLYPKQCVPSFLSFFLFLFFLVALEGRGV
jgi:hypothetical protein